MDNETLVQASLVQLQDMSDHDEFDFKKEEIINILYDIMGYYSSNHQIQLSLLSIIENSLNAYVNKIFEDGKVNHEEPLYFTHFNNKFMEKFFYIFLVNNFEKKLIKI
jgi:hypothetical protein